MSRERGERAGDSEGNSETELVGLTRPDLEARACTYSTPVD